jgi:outer membrane protein TolC
MILDLSFKINGMQFTMLGFIAFGIRCCVEPIQLRVSLFAYLLKAAMTKGVIIQIRAQALPHITPSGTYEWIDPNLRAATFGNATTTTTGTTTGAAASIVNSPASQVGDAQAMASPTPKPSVTNTQLSDISYNIRVTGTQLVFNGTTWPAIRGTFFQRDSAYFAFRNTLDQLLATVKTQFYQVVVNRESTGAIRALAGESVEGPAEPL